MSVLICCPEPEIFNIYVQLFFFKDYFFGAFLLLLDGGQRRGRQETKGERDETCNKGPWLESKQGRCGYYLGAPFMYSSDDLLCSERNTGY